MCLQFFEVDLPQVSEKKIDLVDAVIPDKQKVRVALPTNCVKGGWFHLHTEVGHAARRVLSGLCLIGPACTAQQA